MARHQIRDLSWAAGFFEGEGCVSRKLLPPRKDGFRKMYLLLTVGQIDKTQPLKFQEMFGGAIHQVATSTGKSYWTWSAQNEVARAAMELMAPYFVGKTKYRRYLEVLAEIRKHYKSEPKLVGGNAGKGHSRSWGG